MYGVALSLSVATTAATTGVPFIHLGELDLGIPIQAFGVIVAIGVLVGAWLFRRYAEWHGVSDDDIRGLLGWVTVTGFLGAHVFDVLAYEPHKLDEPVALWGPSKWPVLLRVWDGISSYGGFIGGALGFAIYVWWKRLPARLMADVTIIGLLTAFTIGRLGCTVVSDHVGSYVEPDKWYASLAMNYPTDPKVYNGEVVQKIVVARREAGLPVGDHITVWNLGLIELLYLIPVTALILWLAFRTPKRSPAGFITVLTGVLYAPVRFFLDYLRPETTDERHLGLTFAQWASILAFGAAGYAAVRILRNGKPADIVAPTSREAQERLKMVLAEDDKDDAKAKPVKTSSTYKPRSSADPVDDKDADKAKPAPVPPTAPPSLPPVESVSAPDAEPVSGDDDDEAAEEPAPAATPATKPAAGQPARKPGGGGGGKSGKNKNKNRKR